MATIAQDGPAAAGAERGRDLPFVSATIEYAGDIKGRGRTDVVDWSRSNLVLEPCTVPIFDARPIRERLSLDREGFVLVAHESALARAPEIRAANREHRQDAPPPNRAYHDEMAQMIRELTGAREVLPQRTLLIVRTSKRARELSWAVPSCFAHMDYTESAAHQFLQLVLEWEKTTVAPYRRFAVYQTWRAISPPPQDNLLAVCDGRTVADADVVVIDTVVGPENVPGNKFETRLCRRNPAHRWYYFPNMRDDEVLVFKGFDSADPAATNALHAAFDDPGAPPGAEPRVSIETRLFAFFD